MLTNDDLLIQFNKDMIRMNSLELIKSSIDSAFLELDTDGSYLSKDTPQELLTAYKKVDEMIQKIRQPYLDSIRQRL